MGEKFFFFDIDIFVTGLQRLLDAPKSKSDLFPESLRYIAKNEFGHDVPVNTPSSSIITSLIRLRLNEFVIDPVTLLNLVPKVTYFAFFK